MSAQTDQLRRDADELEGCGAGNEAGRVRKAADHIDALEARVAAMVAVSCPDGAHCCCECATCCDCGELVK